MAEFRRDPEKRSCDTAGYTGLELVTFFTILLLTGALIVHLAAGNFSTRDHDQGIIPEAVGMDADELNVFGSITGFSATNREFEGISVVRPSPDSRALGAVEMTLSLFLGSTGGIDMATTNVTWADLHGTRIIPFTKDRTVICPNWTVMHKYNVNPFKPADQDDILEPGEQFDILICPAETLPPYEEFTIIFDPAGSGPHFPVKCSVPFMISPTMVL